MCHPMRPLITTALAVILSAPSFCQTTLRVTYEGTDNALKDYFRKMRSFEQYRTSPLFADEAADKPRRTTLITDGVTSVFIENEEMSEDELDDDDGPQIVYISQDYWGEEKKTYKDLNRKTVLVDQVYGDKSFYITEPFPEYDWVVKDERMSILGMECQRAVVGDSISAWFTFDIPVGDGPALSLGLPGLILKLDDGHEQYECVGIEEAEGGVPECPKVRKTLTLSEFRKFVIDDIDKMGSDGGDF